MNSVYHAKSAAKKWGGVWQNYIDVEELIDSSKQFTGDARHRALFHNTYGVWLCQRVFGRALSVTRGDRVIEVPVRLVAEQHIIEDLGWLPSPADYFRHMELATWMSGAQVRDESLEKLGLRVGPDVSDWASAEDAVYDIPVVTKTGRVMTDSELDELAREAEAGYDITRLRGDVRE